MAVGRGRPASSISIPKAGAPVTMSYVSPETSNNINFFPQKTSNFNIWLSNKIFFSLQLKNYTNYLFE